MKYLYYVSYYLQKGETRSGFGFAALTRATPIDSEEAVLGVKAGLEANNPDGPGVGIVPIAWTLLRTEEDAP